MFTCKECSSKIKKIEYTDPWLKRSYEVPNDDDKLWRYLDLSKYISMISTNALYFSVASAFEDKFEGARGVAQQMEEWDKQQKEYYEIKIKEFRDRGAEFDRDKQNEQIASETVNRRHFLDKAARNHTFLSCWHIDNHESDGMWRAYCNDLSSAVAVQTTYKRLYTSLDDKYEMIEIGNVKYKENMDTLVQENPFWVKTPPYRYESEARAIFNEPIPVKIQKGEQEDTVKPGINVPINLDILIEKVYVSPYAQPWFYDVVKSVSEKYLSSAELIEKISMSEMSAKPGY